MVVTTYNPHVRLLSPGPWLVGTTKVYPGVGADIVMESVTPKTLNERYGCLHQLRNESAVPDAANDPPALNREVQFPHHSTTAQPTAEISHPQHCVPPVL
jgi:hypothetical protein